MNKNKIAEVINEIKGILPVMECKIHNINNGGCGVFAFLLWRRLKELGVDNIRAIPLIYPANSPDEVNTAFVEISNGADPYYRECGFSHIILEVYSEEQTSKYLIDSEGIEEVAEVLPEEEVVGHFANSNDLDDDDNYRYGTPMTFELLESLARDTRIGLWNTDFDRHQIPKMKEIFERIQPVETTE